jgi:hypothetical protein
MTYMVAAILDNDASINTITTPRGEMGAFIGEGLLNTGSLSTTNFDKTQTYNLQPDGYAAIPVGSTIDDFFQISRSSNVAIINSVSIAVNLETCVSLLTGWRFGFDSTTNRQRQGMFGTVRVTNQTSTTSYDLASGWEYPAYNSNSWDRIFCPISVFSGNGKFYIFYVVLGNTTVVQDAFRRRVWIGLKESDDGIDWQNVTEQEITQDQVISPFLHFAISGTEKFAFQSTKSWVGDKYFIGDIILGKLIYSNNGLSEWTDHPIGRFNGLHWYTENGAPVLCAVRIGDDGCFGTKICDVYGNMLPISWKRSATPWDWSINRLDAGYIAPSNKHGGLK